MRTIQLNFGGIRVPLLGFARIFALAGVMALTACGGGSTDAPAVPVDNRETSVTATQSFRWTGGGVDGIALGALTAATDGGLWVAGTEGGFFGRPFLRKFEGAGTNPCGAEGSRFLSEISGRFERRQGVVAMSSVQAGAFYLAFQGPASVLVARYLEATCSIDPGYGDRGVAVFPIPGLLFPNGVALQREASDGVLVAVAFVGSFHLRRLTAQGAWDTNFGNQGVAANPNADSFWLGGLARAANGDILVSGSVSIPFNFQPALMKLDAAGRVVNGFGTAGVQRYPELSLGTGGAGSMVVEADRVVFGVNTAASVALDDITTNDSVVAAVDLMTGRLLPNFGRSGFLRWDWGYNNSNLVGVWRPNGRGGYTTCGHVIKSFVLGQPAALVDVTGTGQFDTTVPFEGRRLISQTSSAQCAGIARLSDGRLAAAINEVGSVVVMIFNR